VYQLAPDRALVATVDFFTPIVDDAATWGAIAAANALSDIYAMGARPLFALNLVGWPRDVLPFELLGEVLRGAGEVARQAGCAVVGGHSIDDAEPKFGMAVFGEAHPDRLLTNAGARPGDRLVLTKPLGTGILTTALKQDLIGEAELAEAVRVMTTLNAGAARAALASGATAATDVTGFGLLGHLGNILASSGVGASLKLSAVPILAGARELALRGVAPGGTKRNLSAVSVDWAEGIAEADRLLLADAQTSGGLLIAISEQQTEALLAALRQEATPVAVVIGVVTSERGQLRVEP
jgi:selenide, water dikinase